MELTISTPAILFSTVSLMIIAFTNRYLAIASLIRELHEKLQKNPNDSIALAQIRILQRRVYMIRNIQVVIVSSLLMSSLCILFIYLQQQNIARSLFFIALLLQIFALCLSIWEITMSIHALKIELSDIKEKLDVSHFGFFSSNYKDDITENKKS